MKNNFEKNNGNVIIVKIFEELKKGMLILDIKPIKLKNIIDKIEDFTKEDLLKKIYSIIKNFNLNIETKLYNKDVQTKEDSICNEDYNNLEKILQKYEAEIRNHIRIEQQMKIYTDSLKERITFLEKKFKKKEDLLRKNNDDTKLELDFLQKEMLEIKNNLIKEDKKKKNNLIKRNKSLKKEN